MGSSGIEFQPHFSGVRVALSKPSIIKAPKIPLVIKQTPPILLKSNMKEKDLLIYKAKARQSL